MDLGKLTYKSMLRMAVTGYLCERDWCRIEDHHAISDVMSLLNCNKEFAVKLLKEIKISNPFLIIDTGEGL